MPTLVLCKFECREQAPRLVGIVVRDRSLEPFARGCRLAKLAAQPAEEPDGIRARHATILAKNRRVPYPRLAPID